MRVSVTELKNQLSKYLRLVKRGETVEVVEHSVPIARLERISSVGDAGDARRERLIRDGVVTPAIRTADPSLANQPPVPCSIDPVEVLVEQRGDR